MSLLLGAFDWYSKASQIKIPPTNSEDRGQTMKTKNYKNYDAELFRADLNRIPWDIIELEANPDNAWNSFKDLFMTAADCNAPVVNP